MCSLRIQPTGDLNKRDATVVVIYLVNHGDHLNDLTFIDTLFIQCMELELPPYS